MTRATKDTIESLTKELQEFCEREGLPRESADDLLVIHTALTDPQRQWLTGFEARWDAITVSLPAADTRESLTTELRLFCEQEGIPFDHAEDLDEHPGLGAEERTWLSDWWQRWHALHDRQDD